MTLGREGVLVHDVLQLHCQQTLALIVHDYVFLWLNKSRHASSSVKICMLVIAVCIKHYIAKSVHVATGKQETSTVKEAQVCKLEDIASTIEYK